MLSEIKIYIKKHIATETMSKDTLVLDFVTKKVDQATLHKPCYNVVTFHFIVIATVIIFLCNEH